jgi:hypothetical protein
MPFTISHPALILPLNYLPKKWISLTGLAIGSLTPDFEYFLRMKIKSNFSHTLWGILWFDLPLGILLTFIYHNIVKNEFIKNLPKELNSRFLNNKKLKWNNYFAENWKIVTLSLFIGILSHIFWDSFTHESGFFVKVFSELQNTIEIFGKPIKILKLLQHSSTIIGGILIIYTIYKLPKSEYIKNEINPKYWINVILITFIIFAMKFSISENPIKIGNIIVSLISAGIIGLIFTPYVMKRKNRT